MVKQRELRSMRYCKICNKPHEEGEEDACYDCACNILIDDNTPPDFDEHVS